MVSLPFVLFEDMKEIDAWTKTVTNNFEEKQCHNLPMKRLAYGMTTEKNFFLPDAITFADIDFRKLVHGPKLVQTNFNICFRKW